MGALSDSISVSDTLGKSQATYKVVAVGLVSESSRTRMRTRPKGKLGPARVASIVGRVRVIASSSASRSLRLPLPVS